jgi:hypothetical protein
MRINIWHFAAAINAAKAAGFDVDNLLQQVVQVFIGQASGAAIPAQLIQEVADVVTRFANDPITLGMDMASAAAMPEFAGVITGWVVDAFGLPRSVKFGPVTIVYTVSPPKKLRKIGRKSRTRRRAARRRKPPVRRRKPKRRSK